MSIQEIAKLSTRSKIKEKKTSPNISGPSIFLPLRWGGGVTGVPNYLSRSALFSATTSTTEWREDVRIATLEGLNIFFRGFALSMLDRSVWKGLLELSRRRGGTVSLCFKFPELLRILGVNDSGGNREKVIKSLKRLNSAHISLESSKFKYYGVLLPSLSFDENKKNYIVRVKLDEELSVFFYPGRWKAEKWEICRAFGRDYLAGWLYSFFLSFCGKNGTCDTFTYTEKKIYELSGSTNNKMFSFRQKLKKALEKVREIDNTFTYSFTKNRDGKFILKASFASPNTQNEQN